MDDEKHDQNVVSWFPLESATNLTDLSDNDIDAQTNTKTVGDYGASQPSPEFSRNFKELSKINAQLFDQFRLTLPLIEQFKNQSKKFSKYIKNDDIENDSSTSNINKRLFEVETTLNMILKMDKNSADLLIDELELPILKQFKHYLKQLKKNKNTKIETNTYENNYNSNYTIKVEAPQSTTNDETKNKEMTGVFADHAVLVANSTAIATTTPQPQQPQQPQQQHHHSIFSNIDISSITNAIVSSLTQQLPFVLAHANSISNSQTDSFSVTQDQSHVNDDMSLFSGATGVTGVTAVSSIAPSYLMNDPVVIMMGIGEYDGMPSLDGVSRDYDNIINTFSKHWKYKILYQLSDNTNVYSNNSDELTNKTHYKLKWDIDEIKLFVEQVRKCIIDNKHDGFLFAISSHGDTGKVIYDSNCDVYNLDMLFSMFSPMASILIESHSETKKESQRLFQIPKLFFLDHCRGSSNAKVTNLNITNVSKNVKTKDKDTMAPNDSKTSESDQSVTTTNLIFNKPQSENTKQKTQETQDDAKHESFSLKTINKDEAKTLVAQMANFCKLYANIEGYTVAGGTEHGGLFLRNVCKCFKDVKFIRNHQWDEIIIKIREYTKRDATIVGLINFTQIVENEGTLERPLAFGSKYMKFKPVSNVTEQFGTGQLGIGLGDINEDYETETHQITITNVSKTNKIAVLVEHDSNREDRKFLIKSLTKTKVNVIDLFNKNRYVIIDQGAQSKQFDKFWEMAYVSLFELSNDAISDNKLILDRSAITSMSDHLYYVDKTLSDKNELIPKCKQIDHEIHLLDLLKISNDNESQCVMCGIKFKSGDNGCRCAKCDYYLCDDCCHLMICKQLPFGLDLAMCIKNIQQVSLQKLHITCNHKIGKEMINEKNFQCCYELKSCVKSEDGMSKDLKTMKFDVNNDNDEQRLIIDLDDDLKKEFKEENCLFDAQLRLVDTKKNVASLFCPIWSKVIRLNGFFYECVFTTLNGNGRYGPTQMNDYKGKIHEHDTRLDDERQGMQLWTVPQSGKWHVICYGAAGGDSMTVKKDKHLHGGLGAKVGGIIQLYKNDVIKILVGQMGTTSFLASGAGGGGGTYFVLYKCGADNPSHLANSIVNVPLIIASGGNGAGSCQVFDVKGVSGLGNHSENRDNYGGCKSKGQAGRGGSFKNDFDSFTSYVTSEYDYNKCNPLSFVDGCIGGSKYGDSHGAPGGFGGGGGASGDGGGGGGYIGGFVDWDYENKDPNKYALYGALSYNICQHNHLKMNLSGQNDGDGKIQVSYWT